MVPWFQYCTDLWFTGFDPPRTLVPAEAIAPAITTSDPAAPTIVPQPSVTHDPGAKKTAAVWNPIPLPSPLNHVPLPKETKAVPELKPQVPQPQPANGDPGTKHQDPSQQESGSTDPSGQSNVQTGGTGNPNSPGGSNQVPDSGDSTPPHDATVAVTTMALAGHSMMAGPSGVYIDGVKVSPNEAPAVISGGAAINQGNSIVLASQIFHLSSPTDKSTTTIAGQEIIALSNGALVQGHSITSGATPVIISGTTISVDNSHIYFGSKSYLLPTAAPGTVTKLANGAEAIPLLDGVSIYGTTFTAGEPAATILGTVISFDASRNLIFDGTAQALPSFPPRIPQPGQVTTINGVTIQLLPSGVSVAGTTLTPGAPAITASGTPISLGSTGFVVGTSSVPVSFGNPQSLITTIGGQAITAAETAVEIGTATLTPGAQGTTLGGTLVSLDSGGNLVIGSKTVGLGSPSGSLGGLILEGFGSGGPSTNSSLPTGSVYSFEGKAGCLRRRIPEALAGLIIALHLMLYLHI